METRRTKRIAVTLTEAEHAAITAAAEAQHLDPAVWARRALLLQVARERAPGQTA